VAAERFCELLAIIEPPARVLAKSPHDGGGCALRDLGHKRTERRRLVASLHREHFLDRAGHKRSPAGQHLESDQGQRILIGAAIGRKSGGLLG
jgi:hypothetical protein